MTGEIMGPPWQADWTKDADGNRDSLPTEAQEMVAAARAELVVAVDPTFVGATPLPTSPTA
ncbi:hypothetical protein [Streptomyces apocyni]|uniref:hypothetical protein n=1 Tax=Streptomyces apocyni TaxID=2654677 RepID=UPI0012EAEA05|nr:hypothetical protein [Streptomyces apocyni]